MKALATDRASQHSGFHRGKCCRCVATVLGLGSPPFPGPGASMSTFSAPGALHGPGLWSPSATTPGPILISNGQAASPTVRPKGGGTASPPTSCPSPLLTYNVLSCGVAAPGRDGRESKPVPWGASRRYAPPSISCPVSADVEPGGESGQGSLYQPRPSVTGWRDHGRKPEMSTGGPKGRDGHARKGSDHAPGSRTKAFGVIPRTSLGCDTGVTAGRDRHFEFTRRAVPRSGIGRDARPAGSRGGPRIGLPSRRGR